MSYYTGISEGINSAFQNISKNINRSLGIFSQTEANRIHYLASKGYSVSVAKVIVKLEFGWPLSFEELKTFNRIFN